MNHDLEYFRRRLRQERDIAQRCDDVSARRVHDEIAERYAARIETMTVTPPQPRIPG